jgi:hypothetical protein
MHISYWQDEGQVCEDGAARYWYCWVYLRGNDEHLMFEEWISSNLTTADKATRRFNSGNPMTEVTITDESRAMLFKLTFSEHMR